MFAIDGLSSKGFLDVEIPSNSRLFQIIGYSNSSSHGSCRDIHDFSNPVNEGVGLTKVQSIKIGLDHIKQQQYQEYLDSLPKPVDPAPASAPVNPTSSTLNV